MTETAREAPPGVVVVDEGRRRHTRSSSDLLRLIVSGAVASATFVLASGLDDTAAGISIDALDVFGAVHRPTVVTLIVTIQLLAWLAPVAIAGLLLWQRRFRRLALTGLAAGVAGLATVLSQPALADRFGPTDLGISTPHWICSALEESVGLSPGEVLTSPIETLGGLTSFACVAGGGFPNLPYVAAFAAGLSVLIPWTAPGWRRAAWASLGLFVVVRTLDGVVPPLDAVFVATAGYTLGAAILLLFGGPDRRPTGLEIADALARRGSALVEIRAVPAARRPWSEYLATTERGDRLFVKVTSPDDRASRLLAWREVWGRIGGGVDPRPLPSLRRDAEHEAAMSLKAWSDGIRTPRLVAAADVGTNSMLLAFEAIEAVPVESVAIEQLSEDLLCAAWGEAALLRSHRLAHGDLGLHNLRVDADGDPWIVDMRLAELAATDGRLRSDVAQLLVSMAARVGAGRAVAAAVAGIGQDAVADAAPRLQAPALRGEARAALERDKDLSSDLLEAVKAQTGIQEIEFEQLVRVRRSTVLTAVMLGFAFYFLIPQLADVDLEQVAGAEWWWVVPAAVASVVTYAGAAFSLMGSVVEPVGFGPTFKAQVASSFFNRISPAKLGGIAANIRFLQKIGVDSTLAISGVGLSNVAGIVVHVVVLAGFLVASSRSATLPVSLPSGEAVLVGLTLALALAGAVMLSPWGRRVFLGGAVRIVTKAVTGLADIARSPWNVALLLGGSLLTTVAYVFALWYSLESFGGGLDFAQVATVYLAGSAVAQAAPTPGGIGAAEAALIAGLTAFGLAATIAVPAVFLYRLVTFWLPVLPGYLAYRSLASQGAM